MVAKITVGTSLYGALAYNCMKVNEGEGKLLAGNKVFDDGSGRVDIARAEQDFKRYMPENVRTRNKVIHISLNPHPDDRLTDMEMESLAREYLEKLGYGDQPYLIFKHEDINRHHLHIVSVNVDENGRRLNKDFIHRRSKRITTELERKYGLHPADRRQHRNDNSLRKVDASQGDVKRQVSNTVKAVMKAGTNLSSLAPVIKVSEGAKISPASGSTQDFSQPVKYTVTAEDSKTTREYTVTLTVGGEVVLDTSAEPAAGVTLSGNNYTVVAGGAAAATTVKVSLTYSGSPIADLTGYTFAVEATDAKSGAAAAWVKVSQVDASGAFTFTVDPNTDENARRATIAVSCTDNSGAKLFGSGSVGISQDGTKVGAQLIELIDVPGGRFLQGDSPDPTSVIGNARYCNLTSFSIGKYEVTQAQFEEVMGFNPSEFKKEGATHPVESVSIWDAMQFCDELSKREGYTTFYNLSDIQYGQDGSGRILTATRNCDMSATGYRLPTLAEWEYAAKGGAEGIAQYSYLYAGGDNPLEMGWWRENEGEKTHPVGEKPANPIGIHDMCGNVGEWNHDWYERPYMSDFPSTDEVTDPFGPDEPCDADDLAFIRGGDYDTSSEWNLRITYWSLQAGGIDMNPNNMCRQSGIGFRVVIRR